MLLSTIVGLSSFSLLFFLIFGSSLIARNAGFWEREFVRCVLRTGSMENLDTALGNMFSCLQSVHAVWAHGPLRGWR